VASAGPYASLHTGNHTSTPPLSFLQAGCPSCRPTNSGKALKANITSNITSSKQKKTVHTRAGARSEYSGRSWMHLQSLVKSLFLHCSRRCYSVPDWVSNYVFRSLTAARVPRPTFTLHHHAASVTAARLTAMIKPHNRVNRWWKTRFMKPIRQTVVLTSMTAAHSGCRAFKMGDTRLPRHPPTYMIAIADICPPVPDPNPKPS